ncbi:C-GCAxxG-C-C family protein [Anaeromyxobacter diazotrophicus]|uniref:Split soret cytochrome c n=1 Tax=Anaeromyxobacter diazotrophicus TaxID=2590199 RepID=A0A7I9VQL7_9BACT|nr:C-GCAxxG-C-C family protein [Anaeromyxobacter diazotrophicus]GEJ58706.1 hypothetical protein AMYX_34470 [Anaeromyxobacter diazotrophicus]
MKSISRRELITHAGMALGGAVTATAFLGACGGSSRATAETTSPQVSDFPYRKFIPAGYALDKQAIQESAYQLYWAGGCGHGAYKSIMQHLAQTVGAPFNLLPLDACMYQGGGIAGYGSICGAINGALVAINSIVADSKARAAMMTDLIRWYEGTAFPSYVPAAINASEKATLDFSAANIAKLQIVPHSHLCHASRTQWCQHNGVAASSPDLSARCGRLTADVAGKAVELLTGYLATSAYTAAVPLDSTSAGCVGCHTSTRLNESVASGMRCDSCHPSNTTNHPL